MGNEFDNDPEFSDSISRPKAWRRFRLVEIITVVGILGILIGLLMPATRTARPAGRRAQCESNLHDIEFALLEYERVHGALPPAYTVDSNGRPLHSWRTLILPYLEQDELYKTIDLSKPWNDPANAKALETPVGIFRCPETSAAKNSTTYLALVGTNACLLPTKPRRLAEITDSPSSTLMLIEAGDENAVPWMEPTDADESLLLNLWRSSKLHHQSGTNAGFVDGAVRYLTAGIPADVWRAILSISGGDPKDAY
jgi:prepilin-type processing-associated H-X9-DG protein